MQFQPSLLRDVYAVIDDPASFAASHNAAAKRVVTWRLATGDMSIAEPYGKELYGDNAKWKKADAKLGKKDFRHGFDANQRLALVETHEGEHVCHFEYTDSHALRYGHSPPIPNRCVRRLEFDAQSRLVRHDMLYAGHGCQREYTWENGVLRSVESYSWTQNWKHPETDWNEIKIEAPTHIRQDYVHDDQGLFQIVDRYFNEDGTIDMDAVGQLVYLRVPDGVTPSSIANDIARIVSAQTKTLVANNILKDATYYALLICYCAEDPVAGWPPFLLLANESVLTSKECPETELKYKEWAPDELRTMKGNKEIHFSDPELIDLCSLHSQIMLCHGLSSMKLALRQIVTSLREMNWSEIINMPTDFVLASVDNTGEIDPTKDIKAQSPEVFKRLRQRGLI